MTDSQEFTHLMQRLRNGDSDAAAELVQRYESELRIIARARLNDPRLRRLVDSMDICQSILGNFFVRAYAGQFDIHTPEKLMNLLATMIRNKVTDHARRQTADRRKMTRIEADAAVNLQPISNQPSPSSIVAAKDLAHEVRRRLAADELAVVDRRTNDMEWHQIAAELGGSPEALRKKMKRAIDRVATELGLNEVE